METHDGNWTITRSVSTDANGVKVYTSTFNEVEFSAPTAEGDDTIYAGAGGDRVVGEFGDDYIDGGSGDDVLLGSEGSDFIVRGTCNDATYGDSAYTEVALQGDDYLDGEGGNDEFSGSGSCQAIAVTPGDWLKWAVPERMPKPAAHEPQGSEVVYRRVTNTKGENMKAATSITKLAVFVACLAGLVAGQSLAAEPAKARKFDLVFLVGVDEADLKPGVPVFVEPMFFTDGKELVFVYDYCRRDYARIHKGKSPARYIGKRGLADHEMLAEDRAAMSLYCDNRGFSFKGEVYHAHSSLGTRILLGEIVFEGTGEHNNDLLAPEMPRPGLAKISTVEGSTFQIAGSEKFWGPKHYLLASRKSALLADLMPVPRTDEKQIQQFVARAKEYGDRQKGMVIWTCLVRDPESGFCDGLQKSSSANSKGSFAASDLGIGPMQLADIDGDGLLDAMVGLRALTKEKSVVLGRDEPDILTWSATAFLLGNDKSSHFAELDLNHVSPTQFLYYMPLAFLKVGGCRYLLTNPEDFQGDLLFLAQPNESRTCPNRRTVKRLPADTK